jgi:C4-dicarboxylate transporter DctM subunit
MELAILFGGMMLFFILGFPAAVALGFAGVGYLAVTGFRPLITMTSLMAQGLDSFSLLAIVLFVLAGSMMEEFGVSRRLVNFGLAFFGRLPGSMGTVTVLCCAIFAALSGSGPATVAAIGGMMHPIMVKHGYRVRDSAGLINTASALGPIIPPSICMIIYGSCMNTSIPKMFAGGILPGIIMALLLATTNMALSIWRKIPRSEKRYTNREKIKAVWVSLGALGMPVVVLGGIYGGIVTPTEAGMVAIIYTVILGLFYRELTWEKAKKSFINSAQVTATVMFIIAVARLFGWIVTATNAPTKIANIIIPLLGTQNMYWLLLMIILFFVGCLMDSAPATLILAPILVPIGIKLGIDPVHLGVVFCMNLILGYCTPPFGMCLFTTVSITKASFIDISRGSLPYLTVSFLTVFLCIAFPGLVTWLPSVLYSR